MMVPSWMGWIAAIALIWFGSIAEISLIQFGWAVLVGAISAPLSLRLLDLPPRFDLLRLLRGLVGLLRALVVLFIPDALRSTLDMARRVVMPRLPMRPGIVAVPIRFQGSVDRLLLTNHLTLTPGQLVVDYDPDRGLLYLHAIDASDPEALRREVERLHSRARRRMGR